jgi:hypothetical protein
MAMSNAQRQAACRVRHLKSEEVADQRLNLVIDLHAKCALERLAVCYGVTQRAVLQMLLIQAQRAVIQRLDAMSELPDGANQYYDKCLPVVLENATA